MIKLHMTTASCLLGALLIITSCTSIKEGRPHVSYGYGARVQYGEGRHPGIDYATTRGTPIIACSDGRVEWIGEPCPKDINCGGYFIRIKHGYQFHSLYGHLSKAFVTRYDEVKRGQVIGLSGASNNGNEHLHFGLVKVPGEGKNYSKTYNPKKHGIDGKLQCFDPEKDYSSYSNREIIIPVACREYKKVLKNKL